LSLRLTIKLGNLKHLQKKSPIAFQKALEKAAIQFLTWANTGSVNESRTPPIRWGVLRGSSSAFVGNKLVKTFPINIKPGAPESPSPASSHTAPAFTITWVWNTDYATKMHEWTGGWGKFTLQAGNAGNKWLEKHIQADREALIRMIGLEFKKETGI
jgi:hypothetical protein